MSDEDTHIGNEIKQDVIDQQAAFGERNRETIKEYNRIMAMCAGKNIHLLMKFDPFSNNYEDPFCSYIGYRIQHLIEDKTILEDDKENKAFDWVYNSLYDLHKDLNPTRGRKKLQLYKTATEMIKLELINSVSLSEEKKLEIVAFFKGIQSEFDKVEIRMDSIEEGIDIIIDTLSQGLDEEHILYVLDVELAKLDSAVNNSFPFKRPLLEVSLREKSRSFYSVIEKRLTSMRLVIQLMPEEEISNKFRRKIPQIREAHLLGLDSVIELVKRKKEQSNIIV